MSLTQFFSEKFSQEINHFCRELFKKGDARQNYISKNIEYMTAAESYNYFFGLNQYLSLYVFFMPIAVVIR